MGNVYHFYQHNLSDAAMINKKRNRRLGSFKNELIEKSREAALCAVQIFNNPNITFKSESFIVLMMIAWTYLLHAYYREKKIEYRYCDTKGERKRKHFVRTKGRHKYWELEQCLNYADCPLDDFTKKNLLFLIGIRHEIEHQMTSRIDDYIGAKLQACCINYNHSLNKLFKQNIGHQQPLSLQFFSFGEEQTDSLKEKPSLPKNIIDFIASYEANLTKDERNSPYYSYRVIYIRDNVNHEGQADKAIHFIPDNSEEGKEIQTVLIKNKQYKKLTEKLVVEAVKKKGFKNFTSYNHQLFWKTKWKDAKTRNTGAKEYGELVPTNLWLWFEEKWISVVIEHCNNNKSKYQ